MIVKIHVYCGLSESTLEVKVEDDADEDEIDDACQTAFDKWVHNN